MTDESPPTTEVSRMVACRACGNRVARTARRCPACGSPDPAADKPAESRQRQRRPHRSGADGTRRLAQLVIVVAAVALGVLVAVMVMRISARRAEQAPAQTVPAVETASPVAVETPTALAAPVVVIPDPPTPEPSRSRGRRDWPFFFKPGDRLARMGDAKPLGYIISMVKDHRFGDGTVGPAYMLWTPAGKEEAFDADELERTSKLE